MVREGIMKKRIMDITYVITELCRNNPVVMKKMVSIGMGAVWFFLRDKDIKGHFFKKKFFLTFIHFLRDREREQAGVGQREGETQNPKQAPGSELSAQSPTRGSNT